MMLATLLVGAIGGADPLSREELIDKVLTIEEVRQVLEQEDWVVHVPAEPLFTEPEGSITARAIYGLPSINRLLLIILYYFTDEEGAQSFFSQEPEGGQEVKEEPAEQAQAALKVDEEEADEAIVAVSIEDQHRFLRFRWGQFVVHLEINASRATSEVDLTDEKLIKLAKAQFEILVKGRSEE